MSHIIRMNESYMCSRTLLIYEWGIPHIRMSDIIRMNESSHHICAQNEQRHERVLSHTWALTSGGPSRSTTVCCSVLQCVAVCCSVSLEHSQVEGPQGTRQWIQIAAQTPALTLWTHLDVSIHTLYVVSQGSIHVVNQVCPPSCCHHPPLCVYEWVSSFLMWVIECLAEGLLLWVSIRLLWVSSFLMWVIECLVSSFERLVSSFECLVSSFECLAEGFLLWVSSRRAFLMSVYLSLVSVKSCRVRV